MQILQKVMKKVKNAKALEVTELDQAQLDAAFRAVVLNQGNRFDTD